MNALSRFWQKLCGGKEYREAFVQAQAKRSIPLQIRVLLKQRNWSQARLAQEAKLTQGAISRAQDPDYGNLTINTLVRIAAGFDVAFVGRFVRFSDLGRWYTDLSEQAMEVPSFEDDAGFIDRMPVGSAMPEYIAAEATGTGDAFPERTLLAEDSAGIVKTPESQVGIGGRVIEFSSRTRHGGLVGDSA